MQDNAELSLQLANAVFSALSDAGVRVLVASPGFRNSTLALAARNLPNWEVVTAVDERGAAYYALGRAKALGAPVALICTSGTAVANYFPAVMEAYYSRVPLIVLTADRPQELVGTGANQCADQAGVFGQYARFAGEIQPADPSAPFLEHAQYIIGKSVALAQEPFRGPVHVNIRFREPFFPTNFTANAVAGGGKFRFISAQPKPSKEQLEAVKEVLARARRPMIYLGPDSLDPKVLGALACAEINVPVFSEPSSGFSAFGSKARAPYVHRAEQVIDEMLRGSCELPDVVLRFGASSTGRSFGRLLAAAQPKQILIDSSHLYRNPELYPALQIDGDLTAWAESAEAWARSTELDQRWCESVSKLDYALEQRLDQHLLASDFTEWHFAREFSRVIQGPALLFLGNSMPIRDFNSAAVRLPTGTKVLCNRGQSGIDGLLASSVGAASAQPEIPAHLLIGDLSFLHDLSSLALFSAERARHKLCVWVINNSGGEIFRMVATGKGAGQENWFTTPQEYSVEHAARAFNLPYRKITSCAELSAAYKDFPQVSLREVRITSPNNRSVRESFRL